MSLYVNDLIQKPVYKEYKNKERMFRNRLRELRVKAKTYIKNKDWKEVEEIEGCKVSILKLPDSGVDATRGIRTIKTTLEPRDFIEFVQNVTIDPKKEHLMKKLEKNYVYYKRLHSFDNDSEIIHFRFSVNRTFVWDRDFLILRQQIHNVNISYLIGGSLLIPEENDDESQKIFPISRRCVRGKVFCFLWTVMKPSKNTLRVEYFVHSSPEGLVPKSAFNQTVTDNAICVVGYTNEFLKSYNKRKKKKTIKIKKSTGVGGKKNIIHVKMGGIKINIKNDDDVNKEDQGRVSTRTKIITTDDNNEKEEEKKKNEDNIKDNNHDNNERVINAVAVGIAFVAGVVCTIAVAKFFMKKREEE